MADPTDRQLAGFVTAWIEWVSTTTFAELRAGQPPPWVAFGHGAAGTAYALWRIGVQRDDLAIVRQARRWWSIATRGAKLPRATRGGGMARVPIRSSVPLGTPGIDMVGALIAHTLDRPRDRDAALARFAAGTRKPRRPVAELWFGDSGALATAISLHRATGAPTMRALADAIAPRVLAARPLRRDSFAHGNAGVQRALIAWARETGATLPDHVIDAIERPDIAKVRASSPIGLGLSLCNGLAGFVYLWLAAYELTGDAVWLDGARAAALELEAGDHAGGSVCCGVGGSAYALLAIASVDRETDWRARAKVLALRALTDDGLTTQHGMLGGLPGLVCLASNLLSDDTAGAALPFLA